MAGAVQRIQINCAQNLRTLKSIFGTKEDFMSWRPVLVGDLAEQAERAVTAISEGLKEPTPDVRGYSLSTGYAGVALFFGYLSKARADEALAELASNYLSQAFDSAAEAESPALGLFSGLSGLAWTWQHLGRLLHGEASPADTEELDEVILEAVRASPWQWEWDLVYGLSGIGLYVLDHPVRSFAEEAAGQIVDRLAELAIRCPQGIAWRTPPELMTPDNARKYPAGRFDQGVAHGVPGVLGFLGKTCEKGIAVEKANDLLDRALAWLYGNLRAEDGGSRFTYFPPDMADARSAWCYGDPGVSAVLLQIGTSPGKAACRELAVSVACKAACRPAGQSSVADSSLCHGAAGLGHIYNRLFHATGEATLANAARSWFEKALEMRRPGEGIGGYLNWWPEVEEWHSESGFLVGAAGIGLALLSAIYPIEPLWDTPLLLPGPTANTITC
jgi:lantibiotic biosynthesis protein